MSAKRLLTALGLSRDFCGSRRKHFAMRAVAPSTSGEIVTDNQESIVEKSSENNFLLAGLNLLAFAVN